MGYMPEDNITVAEVKSNKPTITVAEMLTFSAVFEELIMLTDVLDRENALLKAHDIAAMGLMNDEKMRLIRKIELRKELIQRHPEYAKAWRPEQKRQLLELQVILDEVLHENHDLVLVAHRINRKVVDSVMKALKHKDGAVTSYTRSGLNSEHTLEQQIFAKAQAVAVRESV